MSTRDEFLRQVWIDNLIKTSEQRPNDPFADVGAILKRLLAARVTKEDLSSIARFAAYEASFGTLYLLEDPGVDNATMLHESLLSADPSGKEGRPGSWPTAK
jgi:hypothetical protein